MSDHRSSDDHAGETEGGEPACWLEHVCPDCGAVLEVATGEHACRRPVARVHTSE